MPTPTPPAGDAAVDAALPATELAVRVDKRVELMSIVMRLAGAKEYLVATHAYAQEVDRAFAAYKHHPAIRMTAELRQKHGIGYDAPMQLAVHLDDQLQPLRIDELPALDRRWTGVDLAAYAGAVRDFASAAKLEAFFDAHRAAYGEAEAKLRAIIGTANPVPFFEQLFGTHGRHVVVPGLLLGTNNVGVRNGDDFYQVLSQPTLPVLVHEMAHSYINPAFARHHAALEAAGTALYPLFAPAMRSQNYVDWQTMFNESGVRALTVLFLRQHAGDIAGAAAARDELRASFVWINELVEVFRKYQRAPGDFDAYMPRVVAFFDALAKQYDGKPPKTPFLGPFDAVLRGDYVLALPAGPVGDYARKLPFFAQIPIVDPAATIEPGRGIVAYGTPSTNPQVAGIAEAARWKITADGIALGDKQFAGKNLVLVATWFRRDDPTRGIAVYAAATEADLVGINNLRHGPRDWLVARRAGKRYEVVDTGDWPFENGAWVPPPK